MDTTADSTTQLEAIRDRIVQVMMAGRQITYSVRKGTYTTYRPPQGEVYVTFERADTPDADLTVLTLERHILAVELEGGISTGGEGNV